MPNTSRKMMVWHRACSMYVACTMYIFSMVEKEGIKNKNMTYNPSLDLGLISEFPFYF
jgi:hypothetical protein